MEGVTDLNEINKTYPDVCVKRHVVRSIRCTKKVFRFACKNEPFLHSHNPQF
jgi:hypothetical protein